MLKIRHIAIASDHPAKAAEFYKWPLALRNLSTSGLIPTRRMKRLGLSGTGGGNSVRSQLPLACLILVCYRDSERAETSLSGSVIVFVPAGRSIAYANK